jgi:tRNA modification GTPase
MDGGGEDTICGIATPVGEGGIGIVRISGPNALTVAEKIIRLRSRKPLGGISSHTLHLADVVFPPSSLVHDESLGDSARPGAEIIDEALVVFMKGPRSFTAEDVVEIHCHGSNIVLGLVCDSCLNAGARLAQPGEFTRRAFVNGRLDLSQAEAVLDTIRAKSEAGLKMAQRHLRGELGRQVGELRARLLRLLAELEAGIDFSEEDIAFVGREELVASLEETFCEINRMLDTSERGGRLRDGARVIIVGRPNVGKSSLLNSLLGVDRAIVTNIPGTTRDVIEESVVWDGFMVALVDTAGLRETDDVVEQEGIKRTKSAIERGDVILYVVDATEVYNGDLSWPVVAGGGGSSLVVMSKSDLVDDGQIGRLANLVELRTGGKVIVTSVRTGAGLDMLRSAIRSCLSPQTFEPNEGAVVTNVRHRHALERAGVAVQQALESVGNNAEPEFVVVDLRDAADALGEVTGAITSDEILNLIFSEFCIGK